MRNIDERFTQKPHITYHHLDLILGEYSLFHIFGIENRDFGINFRDFGI